MKVILPRGFYLYRMQGYILIKEHWTSALRTTKLSCTARVGFEGRRSTLRTNSTSRSCPLITRLWTRRTTTCRTSTTASDCTYHHPLRSRDGLLLAAPRR